MKKTITLLAFSILVGNFLYGQNVKTYRFNGNFKEETLANPELMQICEGSFIEEYVPDYDVTRNLYQFDQNCGFYYDDTEEGFLSSGSYTIELYFKLDNLSSWRRVIDFKNRTTDNGCYIYYEELNFYNIAYGAGAPFNPGEYSHYVITRDANSKQVLMYGNGDSYIEFEDLLDDAVYDNDKLLRFFQDDLVVKNEASAGSIALMRLYNYALDSEEVKDAYNELSGVIVGVNEVDKNNKVTVYPNPVQQLLNIDLPNKESVYQFRIVDILGRVHKEGQLDQMKTSLDVQSLSKGLYLIQFENGEGERILERFIKE